MVRVSAVLRPWTPGSQFAHKHGDLLSGGNVDGATSTGENSPGCVPQVLALTVPAELAINAMPVFAVADGPTETGIETDRAVTVAVVLVFGANAE
jgi:hypothetical protein